MINYWDTIPYILLLGLLLINIRINTRRSNNFCFFVLFVFSAIRFDVGFDYTMYLNVLNSRHDYERFEFFEFLIQQLARHTYIPLFFIINSFITVYFAKWTIEKLSVNISLSLYAFLCMPLLFTHSFSIVRFWSGVSILFYASTFLFDKRNKKNLIYFLIFWIISINFHGSMAIGILFLPLCLFRISRATNLMVLLVSFIAGEFVLSQLLGSSLSNYGMLGTRLDDYAHRGNTESGMTKLPYLYLAIDFIFILLWSNGKRKSDILKNKFITIFNIGVSFLFLFSFDNTLSSRLCRPFLIYIVILVPFILKGFKLQTRQLSKFAFTIGAAALFFYTITIYNDGLGKSEYLPYKVVFFENYDYEKY